MKVNQRTRAHYDATDLDHLRQSVNSRGWQMMLERIAEMQTSETATCCASESSPKMIRKAQGALAALATVLKIPEILEREIRDRSRQAR
jgi:hypothetical protein